jgi:hypothetical protein
VFRTKEYVSGVNYSLQAGEIVAVNTKVFERATKVFERATKVFEWARKMFERSKKVFMG